MDGDGDGDRLLMSLGGLLLPRMVRLPIGVAVSTEQHTDLVIWIWKKGTSIWRSRLTSSLIPTFTYLGIVTWWDYC
jgi:hypothetical protein